MAGETGPKSGGSGNSNGGGIRPLIINAEAAVDYYRAITYYDKAAWLEANGPYDEIPRLLELGTGHLRDAIEPLREEQPFLVHRSRIEGDGSPLDDETWLVEDRIKRLSGVGPRPYKNRRTAEKNLRVLHPSVIGALATDKVFGLEQARELALSRVPTEQDDRVPTDAEIAGFLRAYPDEVGVFRTLAII